MTPPVIGVAEPLSSIVFACCRTLAADCLFRPMVTITSVPAVQFLMLFPTRLNTQVSLGLSSYFAICLVNSLVVVGV